jgi:hypothetical protein
MDRGIVNRQQLCHVLRAAADVAGVIDLVVIGSQAVLGTFEEWRLPTEATRSVEADIAVDLATANAAHDRDESGLADRIDGAIGEGPTFHQTYGYYAQGVETITATLTDGWRDRLVPINCESATDDTVVAVGWCLEINDLWLSKAVAGRPKDYEFCLALASDDLVNLDMIGQRISSLPVHAQPTARSVLARAVAARREPS